MVLVLAVAMEKETAEVEVGCSMQCKEKKEYNNTNNIRYHLKKSKIDFILICDRQWIIQYRRPFFVFFFCTLAVAVAAAAVEVAVAAVEVAVVAEVRVEVAEVMGEVVVAGVAAVEL